MKITIIGSTSYRDKMHKYADRLRTMGHEVKLPFFDNAKRSTMTTTVLDSPPHAVDMNELQIVQGNLDNIKWADRVDILWDQRSVGTIMDLGFVMALDKPIEIVYIEPKTMTGVMRQYKGDRDKRGVEMEKG